MKLMNLSPLCIEKCLELVQMLFVKKQKKLGIPILKLGKTGMYQLGLGRFCKIIDATICEDTSALGVDISCNKILTKEILKLHMLPVPKGAIIKNHDELIKSYYSLKETYRNIILEEYIKGNDYRVCLVDGRVVAASLRLPPFIIGDGKRTIMELIEELNMDPRRGEGHEKSLSKVIIDNILISCIEEKSYNLNSTLPSGEKLFLRKNANLSTGGVSIYCTDEISSENLEICQRAAKAIGLNICEIDICCKDISKSIKDDGAIIEINAAPGIRMHHFPFEGESRNVAKAIVKSMFRNRPKTIPIVSITGTNGKTTVARLIAHILTQAGHKVGLTTSSGIFIDGKCIEKGDTTGPKSALAVLHNRDIDAAVLETARGGILRDGIAYDLADIGIITNITSDHVGVDGVKNIEKLAFIKALVGESIKKDGYAVMNADDNEIIKITKIKDIAIGLNGLLTYNIENAMAAASAMIGLGIDNSFIANGLSTFKNNDTFNPGRFNMYRINNRILILDYGHNIGDYKAVIKEAKAIQDNSLIGIIGVPGDRLDSDIVNIGKFSGDNFDYLYIKEDMRKRG